MEPFCTERYAWAPACQTLGDAPGLNWFEEKGSVKINVGLAIPKTNRQTPSQMGKRFGIGIEGVMQIPDRLKGDATLIHFLLPSTPQQREASPFYFTPFYSLFTFFLLSNQPESDG